MLEVGDNSTPKADREKGNELKIRILF